MQKIVMILGKKWVGVPILLLISTSMITRAPEIIGQLALFTFVGISLMINWFITYLKDTPYNDLKEKFDEILKEK